MSSSLLPTFWLGITPPGEPPPVHPAEPPTEFSVPVSALPPLTNSQASLSGGDIRAVLYALLRQVESYYRTLPPESLPVTFYIDKADNTQSASEILRTYTVSFKLAVAPVTVANEPAVTE